MKNGAIIECPKQKQERLDEYKTLRKQVEDNADVLRRHDIDPNTLLKLLSQEIAVLEHQLSTASQNG